MRYKQTGSAEYGEDGSIKSSCLFQTDEGSTRGLLIHVDNVNFVSPIDGSHIRNGRELIDHNKRHGVSNDLDSLREQSARSNERVDFSKQERKEAINDAINRASSSGYSRNINYE